MYWFFLELGPQLLARDNVWFYFGLPMTIVVHKVPGKMSTVFGLVMEKFFGTVHNCKDTGCVVDMWPSSHMVIWSHGHVVGRHAR